MESKAAEQAADKAKRAVARPATPQRDESDVEDGMLVPGTPPTLGEFQEGTTNTLAMRTSERLQRPPILVPTLALELEFEDSSETQVQPPAPTAPIRMEEGEDEPRKRRRMANKRYTNSQHEL